MSPVPLDSTQESKQGDTDMPFAPDVCESDRDLTEMTARRSASLRGTPRQQPGTAAERATAAS